MQLLLHFGLPIDADHLSQPSLLLPASYGAFTFDYSKAGATIEAGQAKLYSFYNVIYQRVFPCQGMYLQNIMRALNKPMAMEKLFSVALATKDTVNKTTRTVTPNAEIKHSN